MTRLTANPARMFLVVALLSGGLAAWLIGDYARTAAGNDGPRASVLVTTNLPFSEWNQIFQGERMTAALLDRLTHHCHIFEMNGESYRFRESMKSKKNRKAD